MKDIHFYSIFILKTIETEQQNNKICHSVSLKSAIDVRRNRPTVRASVWVTFRALIYNIDVV